MRIHVSYGSPSYKTNLVFFKYKFNSNIMMVIPLRMVVDFAEKNFFYLTETHAEIDVAIEQECVLHMYCV